MFIVVIDELFIGLVLRYNLISRILVYTYSEKKNLLILFVVKSAAETTRKSRLGGFKKNYILNKKIIYILKFK
jgi:hypothetical protein